MTIFEIEQKIADLRSKPLLLVCRTPKGKVCCMSIQKCIETGSAFLHIAADELDEMLERELGPYENAKREGEKCNLS